MFSDLVPDRRSSKSGKRTQGFHYLRHKSVSGTNKDFCYLNIKWEKIVCYQRLIGLRTYKISVTWVLKRHTAELTSLKCSICAKKGAAINRKGPKQNLVACHRQEKWATHRKRLLCQMWCLWAKMQLKCWQQADSFTEFNDLTRLGTETGKKLSKSHRF